MTASPDLDLFHDGSAPAPSWRVAPSWRTALDAADAAPRCGARCRTRGHAPCRNPAMPNGRCRMHGGASTGPRTAAGRERCRRAHTIHGARSAYWVGQRKLCMVVLRETRRLKALVDLTLAERAALARGLAPGLDWDDLMDRPIGHIEAQRTFVAALLPPPPPDTPPPCPKVTPDPMHPEIGALSFDGHCPGVGAGIAKALFSERPWDERLDRSRAALV